MPGDVLIDELARKSPTSEARNTAISYGLPP